MGTPEDPAGTWTIDGLAARKNDIFLELTFPEGVRAFPGTTALVRRLRAGRTPLGLVTASRNAAALLSTAGLADAFDVVVDGTAAARLGAAASASSWPSTGPTSGATWNGRVRTSSSTTWLSSTSGRRARIRGCSCMRGSTRHREALTTLGNGYLANRHLTQATVEYLGDTLLVEVQTTQSKIRIATAVRTTVSGADGQRTVESADGQPTMRRDLAVTGRPVVVGKLVAVATSRDAAVASPGHGALAELDRAGDGFDEIVRRHVLAWQRLWEHFAVDVDTDDPVQLAVNLHVFHMLQTISPHTATLDAGCRPADCTVRAIGDTCSGTSCSSYRSM